MTNSYDEQYLQGIAHFNNGNFFDAHEVWEEVWMPCKDEARKFYQGLIQVAVCLHHFRNGNTRGARKLFFSSSKYLADYEPWYLGVDVARLLTEMRSCLADVAASEERVPSVTLDAALLPRIHFCEVCGESPNEPR